MSELTVGQAPEGNETARWAQEELQRLVDELNLALQAIEDLTSRIEILEP